MEIRKYRRQRRGTSNKIDLQRYCLKHLDTEGAEGREKESNLKYVYPSYFMMDEQNKHKDDKSCHEALQNRFKTRNTSFLDICRTSPHT